MNVALFLSNADYSSKRVKLSLPFLHNEMFEKDCANFFEIFFTNSWKTLCNKPYAFDYIWRNVELLIYMVEVEFLGNEGLSLSSIEICRFSIATRRSISFKFPA